MSKRIEPGMLCYVVRMPQPLAGLDGRVVRLADSAPAWDGTEWVWTLSKPLETAMLCNGTQGGARYWIGEVVIVEALQERFLRPITPPASDKAADTEASRDLMYRMSKLAGNPVTVD